MDNPNKPVKHTARFRFYAELNDFLPAGKRQRDFPYDFKGSPGVKDAVEAMGIPHTEIDLIIANGISVGFDYRLRDGDEIAVYPVFEAFDITPIVRLRPKALRETRFVLDVHLGKLARALRLLGFDCAYDRMTEDAEIVERSVAESRIILTRDIGLLKAKAVTHGYWIRHIGPRQQLLEVLEYFDLRRQVRPFTRCTVCNDSIEPIGLEEGRGEAPQQVREWCEEYFRCAGCGKLYWKGTHYDRLMEFVSGVMEETDRTG
ncbi:MAG: Mut7-C ubiquitin/RNAse domain-containing protein [Candidatus Krumholzibacteriota bacterium]|nr:Mut7-C ubiquitin/RNAse domain-containing protein [Candidatus Krumholzibacteriota bacterium]